ncbi:MAG: Ribonuclease P protein component [Nitrospira sp.]|jgi:ribonuclease P protein component|nr:MAG: Ribonuclease P protein component [Nitrospira sp.]
MGAEQKRTPFFLKRSRDIQHIKKNGRRVSTGLFNLQICPGMSGEAMFGIVIGRRFGTAVRRNRAKRLFRELGRSVRTALVPGNMFLVFPKRDCLALPFTELQSQWRGILQKQRLARLGGASL